MVLFRNMCRTNGYVEWRSSLFTKHRDVFSLVFFFYQFAVDFFHFLYFIIMFDSICCYAHQIGLRAGLTRHNMV